MSYTFSPHPGGFLLAPCLQQLCQQLEDHPYYGPRLTNLGEVGDARHQSEGTSSDHNPFIHHGGDRYVRAIDLGGPHSDLLRLQHWFNHHWYAHEDERVYPYGYAKGPDDQITTWFGGGDTHTNSGDEGHLHISVTQRDGNNPSADGWVPALDSRDDWSLPHPENDDDETPAGGGHLVHHHHDHAQRTYTVRAGDTLVEIAARFKDDAVTVASIAALNHLDDPDLIEVGQELKIPGGAASDDHGDDTVRHYRVRPGDTLTAIADHYAWLGITPNSLAHVNHLPDPNLITAGQLLTIG